MDLSIVVSANKQWIRKGTSSSTLKQSISPIFSPTNALNARLCLIPRELCKTINIAPIQRRNFHHMNETLEINKFYCRHKKDFMIHNLGQITKPQDLDQFLLTSEDGSYYCGICHQAMRDRSNIKRHIESKHFPNVFSYQCPECSHVVGTKQALLKHKNRIHPKN